MSADAAPAPSRRALSRSARDAFPAMGVLAIRNRVSGRVRVKSSRNVPGLINRLQFELRRGTHPDKALQAEWNTVGEAGFALEVLEMVRQREDAAFDHDAELHLLEQLYRAELEAGPAG